MKLTKKACYAAVKADYTMLYKPMPEEWKKLFPVMTVDVLENFGFHFTTKHQGKMNGMISLSSTCKACKLCKDRIAKSLKLIVPDVTCMKDARDAIKEYIKANPLATNVCICAFCFSDILQDRQESMQEPLERNFEILNNGIVHSDWIPVLNCLYFRGESFGDFASVNAVVNFYNIAAKNPLVHCTAWTKNLRFFHDAEMQGFHKPENFKLVFSAYFINVIPKVPEKFRYLVNAVFTVFTEEFAELHNIRINCGARACLACLRCYTLKDELVYVNELLK